LVDDALEDDSWGNALFGQDIELLMVVIKLCFLHLLEPLFFDQPQSLFLLIFQPLPLHFKRSLLIFLLLLPSLFILPLHLLLGPFLELIVLLFCKTLCCLLLLFNLG